MLSRPRLASVVIDNYNYARFLAQAIDSALAQTHEPTEVIVVDDGSDDGSQDLIAAYGHRIIPVLQPNGGQDAALNAGYARSRGEVVCFLDADDWLEPTALERAMANFDDPELVKVHWPLRATDARGTPTGRTIPDGELASGRLLDALVRHGPSGYLTVPTSGNAWARVFLERVLPVAPRAFRSGGTDTYLSSLAPVWGTVGRLGDPQGYYRMHGANAYWGRSGERLATLLSDWESDAALLARLLRERGLSVDVNAWRDGSWFHRVYAALQDIQATVPPDQPFILLDGDEWGVPDDLGGRRRHHLLERDGVYWGPPPDDATAVAALVRLGRSGVRFLVVGWPAFWWLDHYSGLGRYLATAARERVRNDRLLIFQLTGPFAGGASDGV